MSRRRGKQHLRLRGDQGPGHVEPEGKVLPDDSLSVGPCACGEPSATVCPECGPQCLRCFMGGGRRR